MYSKQIRPNNDGEYTLPKRKVQEPNGKQPADNPKSSGEAMMLNTNESLSHNTILHHKYLSRYWTNTTRHLGSKPKGLRKSVNGVSRH